MLTIVDDCTRECLTLLAGTWLSGGRVAPELGHLVAERGRRRMKSRAGPTLNMAPHANGASSLVRRGRDRIRNMNARAGGISEADEAGADLDAVRSAAGHSQSSTTLRYVRGTIGKNQKVARMRAAHRNKP